MNCRISAACRAIFLFAFLGISLPSLAERLPVLQQIDVPHNYYFREMYLPQITSGPSALTWSPDGRSLVYSMQGSLWRQALDSDTAEQLTAGPGYDFQPDWSPDGETIVFVRYDKDALELHILDLRTGKVRALTQGGAVNTEPRWSPDGKRLAFVSTQGSGRFQLFIGDFDGRKLSARRLFEERRSDIERYYYSDVDHELSPAWLPDGSGLIYVSNPEVPYGTGDIWLHRFASSGEPALVRREETSWKARPDVAPDGKRIAYASYLGRQRNQLWLTHIAGAAEPFPLTYGDFDITSPRWSPDGTRLAYLSNESGDTAIRVQELVGGRTQDVVAKTLEFLAPMSGLKVAVVDEQGKQVAARLSIEDALGRSYAPRNAWVHADYEYDRNESVFETHYFHSNGAAELQIPAGAASITAWRGPEYEVATEVVDGQRSVSLELKRLDLPEDWSNWVSGDVHVHMNYGGAYRTTPERLLDQARAEDLDVVFNLIVNKEQRVPDIAYFSTKPDAASDSDNMLLHAQEFHTSYWGHLGLLGLGSHLLIPDYSAYPATAAASIYPDNATVARLARDQGALVGYVHPFLSPRPDPNSDERLTNALPVDAALGLVDYYEVVGFADHRASAEVWYGLLNCGARIAAAGGTDAMANYASLRGPLGLNRTYVRVAEKASEPAALQVAWLAALQSGTSMATNGPLVALTINGEHPGAELRIRGNARTLEYKGFLRSATPVDFVELVYNGEVVRTFKPDGTGKSVDLGGRIEADKSGWLLLRAWSESSTPEVLDIYPYATTSPVYVTVDEVASKSPSDAEYFLRWIERIREVAAVHPDYNSDAERDKVLQNLVEAEKFYEACR